MTDRCETVTFEGVTLAVTDAMTKQSEIPMRIPGMFDTVYAWLRESNVEQAGPNYVVYDRFGSDGMRMQVGFPVSKPFADSEQVKCLALAGGKAAHTTLTGPYSGIPVAHTELNAWCTQHGHALSGMSWEIYGDWVEDQSKLVTDIYFRLSNLESVEAKAFVPARDFEQSKRFYQAIGFTLEWATNELASFKQGPSGFLLQKFHVPDHTNNFQMSLLVEDVDAWWAKVSPVAAEFGVRVEPPDDRPWGLRDFPLFDPSGVLWRVGQRIVR